MEFTEREMTTAVEAVALRLFAATRPPWRRGSADTAWESLPSIEKYNRRATAGETVLTALQALPERPTIGARPVFEDHEYAAAAETASRALLDQRRPGSWEDMQERRRKQLITATAALTRLAVEAMPVRYDADHLDVPDHL